MLGVAIRIAQRIGIHNESILAKCTTVEAEMRRRLWWSLVLFDTRVSEIANSRTVTLDPTWDCKILLNVNDSDLRLEMKAPPAPPKIPTEAIFAVVRCELGQFVRHSTFHLDFNSPALKPFAKHLQNGLAPEGGGLDKLEEMIEDQYLKYCDQENPLHFMTVWTTRTYLAKYRLLDYHSRYSSSSVRRTDTQHDAATFYAIRMLEYDTKIMTSPLTKGFLWLNQFHFPFPAYMQIVQDLRRRPISHQAQRAWEVMSDNYEAWFGSQVEHDNPMFQIFTKIVLQAWDACEAAFQQPEELLKLPRIVSSIRNTQAQITLHAQNRGTKNPNIMADIENLMPMPPLPTSTGFADQSLPYSVGMQNGYALMRPDIYSDTLGQSPLDVHMSQFDWNTLGGQPGWAGY